MICLKKLAFQIWKSQITNLELNKSPESMIFAIVQFLRDQNIVLSGELLCMQVIFLLIICHFFVKKIFSYISFVLTVYANNAANRRVNKLLTGAIDWSYNGLSNLVYNSINRFNDRNQNYGNYYGNVQTYFNY